MYVCFCSARCTCIVFVSGKSICYRSSNVITCLLPTLNCLTFHSRDFPWKLGFSFFVLQRSAKELSLISLDTPKFISRTKKKQKQLVQLIEQENSFHTREKRTELYRRLSSSFIVARSSNFAFHKGICKSHSCRLSFDLGYSKNRMHQSQPEIQTQETAPKAIKWLTTLLWTVVTYFFGVEFQILVSNSYVHDVVPDDNLFTCMALFMFFIVFLFHISRLRPINRALCLGLIFAKISQNLIDSVSIWNYSSLVR